MPGGAEVASDLLILAVLAKFFWDLAKSRLVPEGVFLFGAISLAFLLGLSGRLGQAVLKEGLSFAILILFVGMLQAQGVLPAYVGLFAVLTAVYLFGKMARLTGWVIIAATALLLAAYLAYRYLGYR